MTLIAIFLNLLTRLKDYGSMHLLAMAKIIIFTNALITPTCIRWAITSNGSTVTVVNELSITLILIFLLILKPLEICLNSMLTNGPVLEKLKETLFLSNITSLLFQVNIVWTRYGLMTYKMNSWMLFYAALLKWQFNILSPLLRLKYKKFILIMHFDYSIYLLTIRNYGKGVGGVCGVGNKKNPYYLTPKSG